MKARKFDRDLDQSKDISSTLDLSKTRLRTPRQACLPFHANVATAEPGDVTDEMRILPFCHHNKRGVDPVT